MLCICQGRVFAADWMLIPELNVDETYDDNLFFKDISDFEHKISPAMQVQRTTERSRLSLSGNIDVLRYQDYSEYNRTNQKYKLRSSYAFSPRVNVKMNGDFRRDYTFEYEFEESGIVSEQNRRYVATAQPGMSIALTERDSLGIDFSYTRADNKSGSAADYWTVGSEMLWSRSLMDEKTHVLAGLSINKTEFELQPGDGSQTVYASVIGFSRDLGPRLNMVVKAGPTWTDSDFEQATGKDSGNDLGARLDTSLFWQFTELTDIRLSIDHGQYQSIYAENITRSRVRVNIGHNFTQRLRGEFGSSYINSQTEGYVNDEEKDAWQLAVFAGYSLRPNMSVNLGYRYRRIDEELEDKTRDGNRLFVQLTVQFPFKPS